MFLAAPPPPYLLHGGKQLARPRNVRLLPAERRHGLARPGSGPEVRTPTPLISQWDGQVRKGSDENPGRREGRDGRASLGHTHTAAAAASRGGLTCRELHALVGGEERGPQALLQVEGQPPGPTRAQRRVPPRPRLPGPSGPVGASATQPEGRGPRGGRALGGQSTA